MKQSKTIYLIFFLIFLVVVLVAVQIMSTQVVLKLSPAQKSSAPETGTLKEETFQSDSPKILSTKPDPLEEAIVGANENIEIIFNRSLENVGEFKLRIEPKIDYKIELSQDRKTAKIIPVTPYELGTGYTLFIGPDTKFDGIGAWGQEKIFHFKTIKYRGV